MDRKRFFLGLFFALLGLFNCVIIGKLLTIVHDGAWACAAMLAFMLNTLVAGVMVIMFALKYRD